MKLFETKITKEDADIVSSVLQSGDLGFGPNVRKFEQEFKSFSKADFNISTNSASASAFMIFAYLQEWYGSCDVYTTSLGFTSPAWAAKHFGHNLIWVDVDTNLLFDVEDYKDKRRMRCERYTDGGVKIVVMPVLYGGFSYIPRLDSLQKDNFNELIVLDAAHCVTSTQKAHFTFYSFHPYKPVAASDGGMISTNNPHAVTYFEKYRNFGRHNLSGGGYTVDMEGFKFYMNNLNATIALTQLKKYEQNKNARKKVHELLQNKNLPGRLLEHDESSSYYFSTLICDSNYVDELYQKYPTSKHYPMLHKMPYYYSDSPLHRLESIHPLILNLPLHDINIYNS
jgi:dTDP-4-amino-4,6-dideoxygalactose transaminase